jgi:HSP20 family protein
MTYFLSPFNALNQMNRELNRVFNDQSLTAQLLEDTHWTPQVDITENDDSFHVSVDVPGVSPEQMEISLHKGLLTIRGKRNTDNETEDDKFSRRERIRGSFSRQFNLPDSANEETVTAKSVNGVLKITIPKAKKSAPISITVDGE